MTFLALRPQRSGDIHARQWPFVQREEGQQSLRRHGERHDMAVDSKVESPQQCQLWALVGPLVETS